MLRFFRANLEVAEGFKVILKHLLQELFSVFLQLLTSVWQ